jgi:hypothetical protein
MKVAVTLSSFRNISFNCSWEIDMEEEFGLTTEECEEMTQEELDDLVRPLIEEILFDKYITLSWDYK